MAHAQLLVAIDGAAALPVASPQTDVFQPGVTAGVAVQLPLSDLIVPALRADTLVLFDGGSPRDPTLRDPGVGSVTALAAAMRVRPIAAFVPTGRHGDSLWLEVSAGAGVTGSFVRPVFAAAVGWAFSLGSVDVGPVVRFVHVPHWDDPLDSRSALVLTLGIELTLLDEPARPQPPHVRHVARRPPAPVDGDRDHDGIRDSHDRCPDEAEDVDGFEDDDGCPDPDNDHDGIPDANDACPRDAEVVNGVDDTDGCPDVGLITMIDDRVVLDERVLFDLNRSRVKHEARPMLEAIAALWRQHSEWSGLRVEGHADETGTAEWNMELSQNRADRVREALVGLGMPAGMLVSQGFGDTRPRDTRGTAAAHQTNRRVEFVVVRPEAAEAGAP